MRPCICTIFCLLIAGTSEAGPFRYSIRQLSPTGLHSGFNVGGLNDHGSAVFSVSYHPIYLPETNEWTPQPPDDVFIFD